MSARSVLTTIVAFAAGILITLSLGSGDAHEAPVCPSTAPAVVLPPVATDPPTARSVAQNQPPIYDDPNCKKGITLTTDPPLLLLERQKKDPSAPKPPNVCKRVWPGSNYGWVFSGYEPSEMEVKWAAMVKPIEREPGYVLCNLWNTTFKQQGEWLLQAMAAHHSHIQDSYSKTCGDPAAMAKALPGEFDHRLFSRFKYEFKCVREPCKPEENHLNIPIGTIRYGYIEPLVGLLRHPNLCADYWRMPHYGSLLHKDYMLMDRWPLWATNAQAEKVLYFDAGASLWSEGSGGASQGWLYDVYEKLCTPLTDYYAWEITPISSTDVWNAMPGHVRPKFHWYNIALQTGPESWNNPHNHILSQASKEDIVIWKIDFDATQIEDQLIKQILEFPELAERIDELYFEHHINMEYLRDHWGTHHGPTYQSDSIKMFQELRKRGIRAHSWV